MPLNPLNSLSGLSSLSGSSNNNQPTTPAPPVSSTTVGPSWLTGTLAQIAIILLGLLLIAGGLFSFDKVQEVAKTVGKTAAVAA